jgi:hypothetical protein
MFKRRRFPLKSSWYTYTGTKHHDPDHTPLLSARAINFRYHTSMISPAWRTRDGLDLAGGALLASLRGYYQ